MEVKVRKVGKSAAIVLTSEMLAILGVKPGDTLYVTPGGDGSLKVTADDPSVSAALAAAEIVMNENGSLLAALA